MIPKFLPTLVISLIAGVVGFAFWSYELLLLSHLYLVASMIILVVEPQVVKIEVKQSDLPPLPSFEDEEQIVFNPGEIV